MNDPKPFEASVAIIRLSCTGLAAKDQWMSEEASSDPWLKFFVASSEQAAAAVSDGNESFSGQGLVEMFRTEVIPKNLNPQFGTIVVDLGKLKKTIGDNTVVVGAFDYDWTSQSDLIGVTKDVVLTEASDATYDFTKRGVGAGAVRVTVELAWAGHRRTHQGFE
ncbi:hypothetical protein CTAYLR_006729 [Chrysophaeum taylorii]|uniref:C2 domain-containing protein n=1 Tax=Chrysophaeum taylorii TaxID=2483200 RepID=A0AAD7XKC1_9STRA|nr:hypothetical protein CTAYLR_006729 [Chrysophaeum taylorii]